MSSKRDWNDVSDDDSADQNNISLDETTLLEQNQTHPPPSLLKTSPEALTQKKSISNEEQNLRKLQSCPNEKIWLFVPLYYINNVDQIDKIVNQLENVLKINKFIKGWNILIKREQAKKLIIQGKKLQNFFIKFYFSNKNDDSQQQNYTNYRSTYSNPNLNENDKKVKYIPKSPRSKFEQKSINQFKQPDTGNVKLTKFYSHNDYQISSYKNNNKVKNDEKYDKKDSKFDNKYNKQTDNISDNKQSEYHKKSTPNYKPKYVAKKSQQNTKISSQYEIESHVKKSIQSKDLIKKEKKYQEADSQKGEKSEDSPTDHKGKKKTKKKNEMVKDTNNPYSMLGCY